MNPYEWFAVPCAPAPWLPNDPTVWYVQRYVKDERMGEVIRDSIATMLEADTRAARWNAGEPVDLPTRRTYL